MEETRQTRKQNKSQAAKQAKKQNATQPAGTGAGKPTRRPGGWWKWLALVLIGLILGSAIWFTVRVAAPYETPTSQTTTAKTATESEPAFTVDLTKRQVNSIISYYLKDYLKSSTIKYTLTVGDHAVLAGNFKFFGATVKFSLLFDPLVKANGDVELKARQLNVGSLSVPVEYVLGYVGRTYKLPKWVSLNNKKETVVLELSKFEMASGMKIKANKLDLTHDAIEFAVYLPAKK
ncbi:YpmS family protein [Lacticaseibacillus yichunensis]|uniref:YpmS family protein n=1 Tax=Lacticaseibacillus yichunensis TaxID=2486015 RepID=A0ABW4CU16_9LACO|nr:YpmS family protein [Lacticaseibacillus yichunensis]